MDTLSDWRLIIEDWKFWATQHLLSPEALSTSCGFEKCTVVHKHDQDPISEPLLRGLITTQKGSSCFLQFFKSYAHSAWWRALQPFDTWGDENHIAYKGPRHFCVHVYSLIIDTQTYQKLIYSSCPSVLWFRLQSHKFNPSWVYQPILPKYDADIRWDLIQI